MTLFPVFVDVYHKEQLVTKEEAEKVASDEWGWKFKLEPGWVEVAVTKDNVTATKIADILDKYAFKDVAQHIRGKCVYTLVCVYKYCTDSLIEKAQYIMSNLMCMLHSCISFTLCLWVYINHYSKVHVVVNVCFK